MAKILKAQAKVQEMTKLMYLKGLSAYELSKRAGVSDNTIRRILMQKHYPNPYVTVKVCESLGVPFDDIFELVPVK